MKYNKILTRFITIIFLYSIAFAAQPKLAAEIKCKNESHKEYRVLCNLVKGHTPLPPELIKIVGAYTHAVKSWRCEFVLPHPVQGFNQSVSSMAVVSPEQMVVSYKPAPSSTGGSVPPYSYLGFWDSKTGECPIAHTNNTAKQIITLPDGRIAANESQQIALFDKQSEIAQRTFSILATDPFTALVALPDSRLAIGTQIGNLDIWQRNCTLQTVPRPQAAYETTEYIDNGITALCLTNNDTLVVGFKRGQLHTYNLVTNKWSAEMKAMQEKTAAESSGNTNSKHSSIASIISLSQHGIALLRDYNFRYAVELWDMQSNRLMHTLPNPGNKKISSICALSRNRIAAYYRNQVFKSISGTIKIYNVETHEWENFFVLSQNVDCSPALHVTHLASIGSRLAMGVSHGNVDVWTEEDCTECLEAKIPTQEPAHP